jgi:hypothetical protein
VSVGGWVGGWVCVCFSRLEHVTPRDHVQQRGERRTINVMCNVICDKQAMPRMFGVAWCVKRCVSGVLPVATPLPDEEGGGCL